MQEYSFIWLLYILKYYIYDGCAYFMSKKLDLEQG